MSTALIVNLPVRDLARSVQFFAALGFPVDIRFERFANGELAPLVIGEERYVQLVAAPTASDIVGGPISIQLRVDSRRQVDHLVDSALAADGRVANEPNDQGFLYGRSFTDLDGYFWDVFWLDPAALEGRP